MASTSTYWECHYRVFTTSCFSSDKTITKRTTKVIKELSAVRALRIASLITL